MRRKLIYDSLGRAEIVDVPRRSSLGDAAEPTDDEIQKAVDTIASKYDAANETAGGPKITDVAYTGSSSPGVLSFTTTLEDGHSWDWTAEKKRRAFTERPPSPDDVYYVVKVIARR